MLAILENVILFVIISQDLDGYLKVTIEYFSKIWIGYLQTFEIEENLSIVDWIHPFNLVVS